MFLAKPQYDIYGFRKDTLLYTIRMSTESPFVISPNAELLLTSGGIVTDAMREHALAMGKLTGAKSKIRVLRIADGWESFKRTDNVSAVDRAVQRIESRTSALWSNRYIRWTFGDRLLMQTVTLGTQSPQTVWNLFNENDLILAPGANTHQTMLGIRKHLDTFRTAITAGLPFIGDSAGSIVAGLNLKPASLHPADVCPDKELKHAPALGLVDAEIVAHAKGPNTRFDIPGPLAAITRLALRSAASDISQYAPQTDTLNVYHLNDRQAVRVHAGEAIVI